MTLSLLTPVSVRCMDGPVVTKREGWISGRTLMLPEYYDVTFDDGSTETNVPADRVEPIAIGSAA